MGKNILISAYAISPYKGSEYAAAWNSVQQLAKSNRLWVLYGMSDDHMGDTQTLRDYDAKHPNPNITFIEVKATELTHAINRLNKIGLGWFFYIAYNLWQRSVYRVAKELLKTTQIDVVHQLGPIGFREPGMLFRLNKPFVWGPIGGMMHIDKRLTRQMPLKARFTFGTKNLINYLQLNYSPRIREAFNKAHVLVAATGYSKRVIKEKFGRDAYHLPETWLVETADVIKSHKAESNSPMRLVWSGTHDYRKNMSLCLEALEKIGDENWTLDVLGTGPLTNRLKVLADKLDIASKVNWHGHIPRLQAMQVMANADLHIITSIAEDNPNVLTEAMSFGVPTLTLNQFGMSDSVCSHCGVKIDVDNNSAIASQIASALSNLMSNRHLLADLSSHTVNCAANHHWQKRLRMLDQFYDEAIATHARQMQKDTIPSLVVA